MNNLAFSCMCRNSPRLRCIILIIQERIIISSINRRLGNVIVVATFVLTLIGCSKNNYLEDCKKIGALSNGPYFRTLGGQETFKSLLISNYANYKDKEIKEIIKLMLIENDLDAITVSNSIAVYCQRKGVDYFNQGK